MSHGSTAAVINFPVPGRSLAARAPGLTGSEMAALAAAAHDLPGPRWRVVFEGNELDGRIAFLLADASWDGAPAQFVIGRIDGVLELYDCAAGRTSQHPNLPALLAEVWRRLSGQGAGRLARVKRALWDTLRGRARVTDVLRVLSDPAVTTRQVA